MDKQSLIKALSLLGEAVDDDETEPFNGAVGTAPSLPRVSSPPVAQRTYGAVEPGNIDLGRRPHVQNTDGSVSTVRSLGVNIDGKEVLIPTVSDEGRIMSDDEAINRYKDTGRHLGVYDSPEASTRGAEQIHRDQVISPPVDSLKASATQALAKLSPAQADAYARARLLALPETRASSDALDLAQNDLDAQEHVIDAERFGKEADAIDDEVHRQREVLNEADTDASKYRAQRREAEDSLDAVHAEMTEQIKHPPPKTMQIVFGIIGAVLSAAGKGGVGQGVMMLGDLLDKRTREYNTKMDELEKTEKLQRGRSEHKAMMEGAVYRNAELENSAHWSVLDRALEGLEKRAQSDKEMIKIAKVRAGFRQQTIDKNLALRAANDLAQREDMVSRLPVEQLMELNAKGLLDKRGQKVLAEKVKNRTNEVELAGKEQEMFDRTGEVIPGFVSSISITPTERAEIRKNSGIIANVNNDYRTLAQIYASNKGRPVMDQNDKRIANAIVSGLGGKLSQMNGMGAPSEAEREAMLNSIPDPSGWYLMSDPVKVFNGLIEHNNTGFESRLGGAGIYRASNQSTLGSGPPAPTKAPTKTFGRY